MTPSSVRPSFLIPISGAEGKDFRIQAQYQTSLTISDEGPHLDLLDWKHYESEWSDLEQLGNLKFRMPTYTDEETSAFQMSLQKRFTKLFSKPEVHVGQRWSNRSGDQLSTLRV
jgi:hypothetical protein